MAEMGVAERAFHLSPQHAHAEVIFFADIFRRDRFKEAGPAGAGFKLCFRIEQSRAAIRAAKNSGTVLMQKLTGARYLRSSLARDRVLRSRQDAPPFLRCFVNFAKLDFAGSFAVVVELHDFGGGIRIFRLFFRQQAGTGDVIKRREYTYRDQPGGAKNQSATS